MVRVALLAIALLISGVAVMAVTPSSFDVESAYHQANQPVEPGSHLRLAAK
jgi:hypothetical protein